jgi:hypothetical protein
MPGFLDLDSYNTLISGAFSLFFQWRHSTGSLIDAPRFRRLTPREWR